MVSSLPFVLVFEDVSGANSKSDKAVDDVLLVEGACQPYASCDFESSSCGWMQVLQKIVMFYFFIVLNDFKNWEYM